MVSQILLEAPALMIQFMQDSLGAPRRMETWHSYIWWPCACMLLSACGEAKFALTLVFTVAYYRVYRRRSVAHMST